MITFQCPRCFHHWKVHKEEVSQELIAACPKCNTLWRIRKKESNSGVIVVAHPPSPFLNFLESALKQMGYKVKTTSSGKTLKKLLKEKPICVLSSVFLEHELGVMVCEWAKSQEETKNIPFVLIGALHKVERYRRPTAKLYGADDYIEEDIDIEELKGIIRRLTGWRSLPAEPRSPEEEHIRREVRLFLSRTRDLSEEERHQALQVFKKKLKKLHPTLTSEVLQQVMHDYIGKDQDHGVSG